MSNSNIYYKYYDILYDAKDYVKEVNCILDIAGQYQQDISKVLEIGCGTGNHTLELAKNDFEITAIDIEQEIFQYAEKKISELESKNVKLQLCRIEDLDEVGFDLALAMFNVVTYIKDQNDLSSFFEAVFNRLEDGGVFIFDCWNGVACMIDPPEELKQTTKTTQEFDIVCNLTNKTDRFSQNTELVYDLKLIDKTGDTVDDYTFSFDQTLWTPKELEYHLTKVGFEIISCSQNFEPTIAATEKDYRIMYVCRKAV